MKILANESEPAFRELISLDKYLWTRCQFSTDSKNHYITNNLSESFNAWVLEARYMPAVDLVDKIRIQMMSKFEQRKKLSARWKGKLVPYAERYVQELSRNLGAWVVRRSADGLKAEVENESMRREIDLGEKTCSCGRWQLIGLPCVHVANLIATIRNSRWEDYVDPHFFVERYKKAYALSINTLPSKDQWRRKSKGYTIGPPHTKRPRGRPKKKRIRGVDEKEATTSAVSKRIHKCSRCGGWGHHKNACKEPLGRNAVGSDAAEVGSGNTVQNRAARGRGRGKARGRTGSMGRGRGGNSAGEGAMEQTSASKQTKEQELKQCAEMWERHKEQFRGEGSNTSHSAATGSLDNWDQIQIVSSQTSVNMSAARGRGRGRSVAIRGRSPATRKTLSKTPLS